MPDIFAEVNERSGGGESEFRIHYRDAEKLVLIGGFALDYYHDFEITFHDVRLSTCPDELRWPQFVLVESAHGQECWIHDDEGAWLVVAREVSVEVGKVYHYDRGKLLRPGERIAPWVRRR